MQSVLRSVLAVVLLASTAFAGEVQLSRDPAAKIAELSADPITSRKPGKIQLKATWSGHTVRIDASAVGDADFDELYALAGDYDAYPRMKMPYVDNARLIETRTDGSLLVWSKMTLEVPLWSDQTSSHFLEVKKASLPNGALANTWQLSRIPAGHRLKGWDSPKFNRLDGSWYQEQLPNGKVYIRYYLSAEIDSGIPARVIQWIGGGQMSDGVRGVIRTLAQQASTSP